MLCFYVQLILDGLMAGALPLGSKFLRSVDSTEPEVLNDYQADSLRKYLVGFQMMSERGCRKGNNGSKILLSSIAVRITNFM
jgi:hypothetical protein